MEEKTTKKKLNTLDKYIIFCLSFLVLYTITHTVIFALKGVEAGILDGLVFVAFSGEILQCFLIKRFKLHDEAKLIFGKKKNDLAETDLDETNFATNFAEENSELTANIVDEDSVAG